VGKKDGWQGTGNRRKKEDQRGEEGEKPSYLAFFRLNLGREEGPFDI